MSAKLPEDNLAAMLVEAKPKTYDDYVHDIKRAFKEDGWKRTERL